MPWSVVVVVGPTAVGKTELVRKLFTHRAEVISADSMQVYRGLDIGTAKPGPEVRRGLPHHLIDVTDPSEQFTVGDFVHAADRLVPQISRRGNLPVISGGTAFYVRGFLFGLPDTPPAFTEIRALIKREMEQRGNDEMFAELAEVDPVTAARISSADSYRIERALEVYRGTGRPLSSFTVPSSYREQYRALLIGLNRPREELYGRINARVERMFTDGLLREVVALLQSGCGESTPCMQGIGYREVAAFRRSGCGSVRSLIELIQRNTRRYAKRQLTFFRRFPDIQWFHPDNTDEIRDRVRLFLGCA